MPTEQWYNKRTDLYHIDPRLITVIEGWNDRVDFDLDELLASIRENGVLQPLRVRRTRDGVIQLRNGERRLRAVMQLIEDGCDIQTVPVILERQGTTDAESLINAYLANTGKPFAPLEEAHCFRRFLAWGWSITDLAQRLGKSTNTVRERLALLDAAPALQQALSNGTATAADVAAVVRAARRTEGDADQQTLLETRQASRATRRAQRQASRRAPVEAVESADADATTLHGLVARNGLDWAVALLVQDAGPATIIDLVHAARDGAVTTDATDTLSTSTGEKALDSL